MKNAKFISIIEINLKRIIKINNEIKIENKNKKKQKKIFKQI